VTWPGWLSAEDPGLSRPAVGTPGDGLRVNAPHAQGLQVGANNLMVNQFMLTAAPVRWPVLVGRAPLLADALQERRGLRNAAKAAADGAAGGAAGVATHTFVGDGGTGKTQLAAVIFHEVRRTGADLALWVTGTSRASVLAAYAQAFAAIQASAGSGDAAGDAAAFLAWLATTDRSWIVVLDDVADPGELSRLWPTGSCGRVVVTTRRRDAAMAARGPVIDVGVFTPQESLDYLTAKLGNVAGLPSDTLLEARELAADLGYLPLALAQAAAVIVNDAITCAAYRALLTDRTRTLADVFPAEPGVSGDEYDQTLAGTWSLAADRADALAPVGFARPLLALVAVLDPNGTPETVLTGRAADGYLSGNRRVGDQTMPGGQASAAGDARRALRNLHRLSLVAHDPNDSLRSVRMHALAQRSAVEHLQPQALAIVVRAAADAVVETWPDVEGHTGLGQVLRANATALADRDPLAMWQPTGHPVVFRTGRSLGEAGLVADAIAHFQAAVAAACRELGQDHPDTLTARYELAYWQGEAGDFAGAAAAIAELLPDRLRVLGPDHPDTLGTRANLAYWRGHAGDPANAAAATEAAIADMVRVLGPDHTTTLSARHNLAHWRGLAGDPAAAVAATEQLLADALRVLGPDHVDTLDTRRNLAVWRGRAGNATGAVTALEQVLSDYTRVLGPDHPDTMHTRDNLADWRGQAGDPAGATAAYQQLLADRLRVLGPDHPHTLATRADLAYWRGHTGDPVDAAAATEAAIADMIRVLGPDHPTTLSARHNHADWRGQAGDAARAVTALEQLLADSTRVLGPDHPDTMHIRDNLADWRGQAGDPAGAVAAYQQLLADTLRVLGPDHPHTLTVRHNLAEWRGHAGDHAGAAAAYEQLLADRLRVLGDRHPNTLHTRHNLAGWRGKPTARQRLSTC
jgi:hypothetical protein